MIWMRCGRMRKEQSSPMRISYEWRMYEVCLVLKGVRILNGK